MYSKEVTAIILSDFAKGASAEETREHLKNMYGRSPCLNTIYAHRNSLTTAQLIDELLRQQERDITKAVTDELRMKYRNELLKILLPVRIIQLNKTINENHDITEIKHVIELVDPDNPAETYTSDKV